MILSWLPKRTSWSANDQDVFDELQVATQTGLDSVVAVVIINTSHYFRRIDEGLGRALAADAAPLVLAGVDCLHPIYRDASSYPHLVDAGIVGNSEEFGADELHERVRARSCSPGSSKNRKRPPPTMGIGGQ